MKLLYKFFLIICAGFLVLPNFSTAENIDFDATVPDKGQPSISITSHINNASYTTTTVPSSVKGSAADNPAGLGLNVNSTVFTLQRVSDSRYWNGSVWTTSSSSLATTHSATTLGTSINWQSAVDLPVFLVDNYILIATATDKSGNKTSTNEVLFSVSSATSIAAPVITYPAENEQVINAKSTIRGTGVAGATVRLFIVNTGKTYTAIVNPAGQWSIVLTEPLPKGNYKIEATQSLGALTSGKAVRNFSVNIPNPSINSPQEGAVVESGKPQITGSGLPGAQIRLTVTKTGDVYTAIVDPSGRWVIDITKVLPNGSYTISVTQSLNGLTSNIIERNFIVGITAPIITWPSEGETIYDTTPTIRGTGIPGAIINLIIVQTGDEYSAIVDENGNWLVEVYSHLKEGDYTIRVTQTYNNLTSREASVNFKLKFTTPITGEIINFPWFDFLHYTIASLVLVGTLILSALPVLLFLPFGLPIIPQLVNFFILFLGFPSRRRGYGIVFDSVSRERLEGATVNLLPLGRGKTEKVKTGKRGDFHFEVKEGEYELKANFKNYKFPSSIATLGYKGGVIISQEGDLYRDIPLDNLSSESKESLHNFQTLGVVINIARVSLLLLGSLIAVVFIIERGFIVDWMILGLYFSIWLIDAYNYKAARRSGQI